MRRKGHFTTIAVILCILVFFINTTYAIYIAVANKIASRNDSGNIIKIMLDIEDKGRYDQFFNKFMESNPDIKIDAIYGKDLSVLIGTVDSPDIIKTGNVQLALMKNHLLPLDINIDSLKQVYYDNIVDCVVVDDKVYALPTSINVSLLYYNKTVFDKHANDIRKALNLSPTESVYPQADWTHEDFINAGKAMTKQTNGVYSSWGSTTTLDWWGEWMIYLRQFGGEFYKDSPINHVSALDSQQALKATEFLYNKCVGENKFAPTAREIDIVNFTGNNVGMLPGGHVGLFGSYNALGLDWDIQVLPKPESSPNVKGGEISCDCFGIYAKSTKQDKALRLLRYWTSYEAGILQYDFGKISPRKDIRDYILSIPKQERQNPKNMEALFQAIDQAEPLPIEKDFEHVMHSCVLDKLQIMLSGGYGPDQAMKEAKRAVDRYYNNMYH